MLGRLARALGFRQEEAKTGSPAQEPVQQLEDDLATAAKTDVTYPPTREIVDGREQQRRFQDLTYDALYDIPYDPSVVREIQSVVLFAGCPTSVYTATVNVDGLLRDYPGFHGVEAPPTLFRLIHEPLLGANPADVHLLQLELKVDRMNDQVQRANGLRTVNESRVRLVDRSVIPPEASEESYFNSKHQTLCFTLLIAPHDAGRCQLFGQLISQPSSTIARHFNFTKVPIRNSAALVFNILSMYAIANFDTYSRFFTTWTAQLTPLQEQVIDLDVQGALEALEGSFESQWEKERREHFEQEERRRSS